MKTLSKDANIDFRLGKILTNLFLLVFLFNSAIPSQSYLNNFGISKIVKTYKGYSQFRILDFNKDGIDDLLLFGNQEKNFVLHEGNNNSTFGDPIKKFFFYPIDDIRKFTKSKDGDDYYIFASRKKRLVGLVSFTKNFGFQLLHTLEFNSYPSSIVITDIDDDGVNDALVYGNNFNGIVKVNKKGFRLKSEILYDQSVFSDLIIKDFNQDEVKDIIAIDVLNNSIAFIENTEINGFTYSREIPIDDEYFGIDEFDYNQDSFDDLVLSKTDGMEIILGDSVNSYSNSQKIPLGYTPYKNIFKDLNNDGIIDLTVINKLDDDVIFYSNSQELNVNYKFHLNGISDLALLNKNKYKKIFLLSKLGKIKIVSSVKKWKNDFSFATGNYAENLKFTNIFGTSYFYLLYDNSEENSINRLKIDSLGNLVELETNQFQNSFTNYDYSSDLLHIVTCSRENRLLEILNKNGLEIDQNYIYSKFPVEQLRFDASNNINILERDGENLYFETIINTEKDYNTHKISFIDSSVVSSYLTNQNLIYYWKKTATELSLYNNIDTISNKIVSISDTLLMKSKPIFLNNNKVISILSNKGKNDIYLINGNNKIKYNLKTDFDLRQIEVKQIKFYTIKNNKTLLINNQHKNKLLFFKFDDKNKLLVLSNSIDGVAINDYFVHNFYSINYLVYSDKNNSCLTFKVLD